MRIAFSGSHRVGKSTLLERIAEAMPGATAVDEPYHLLEEEGYEHSDPPSLEDFEAQLERSLAALAEDEPDALFDRCPLDLLAYLVTHDDGDGFDADAWHDRIRAAMQTLDLVVFVPIEEPDRVALPRHEDRAYRQVVHDALHALFDGPLASGLDVLTVHGDVAARVAQVLARARGSSL